MSKSKRFFSILIPGFTVFFSSGCIMILELVAGRLVARHLGSSLYTWTSVIGVVLAGITVGNYLGGRIADRFNARKALSILFLTSSIACVATIILNNTIGQWMLLWYLKWPLRVFTHVAIVFLTPSVLLGTISPVVTKTALDKGLPTGRTVGDIYACGAAGSIVGTFLAGFYLIAAMGTIAIIWTIGIALLIAAALYCARLWILYLWAVLFTSLMIMGIAPVEWAESYGSHLGLRKPPNSNILYEDESQYNYISVSQISTDPDRRIFVQDKLVHSEIIMDNITDLQYPYEQIYAAVTHRLSKDRNKLSVLGIGGGGYVFQRYIERLWPGSRIDVAEIDPAVTEAATQAFGLERNTTINIYTMDARNFVDMLVNQQFYSKEKIKYDFIYEDAINDFTVPYQLVTKQFNEKIAMILKDDGAYMINLIDIYESGRFLGSVINTLEQTFPHIYVMSETASKNIRNTFVLIASKQKLNLKALTNLSSKCIEIWYLNDDEINILKQKSEGIILTDDYVPVENMLAPVAQQATVYFLSNEWVKLAQKLKQRGRLDEAIATYKELILISPSNLISAYREIAAILVEQGKLNDAATALHRAIEHSEQVQTRLNVASIHFELALLLKTLGDFEQSKRNFLTAIDGFEKRLSENPKSLVTTVELGTALIQVDRVNEGLNYLRHAIDINPYDTEVYLTFAEALVLQKNYDEAVKQLRSGINFMLDHGKRDNAEKLRNFLESIISKNQIKQ